MLGVLSRQAAKEAGVKRYFTGLTCSKGHIAERRVSDHGCVACSREKASDPARRALRREYFKAAQVKWRAENKEASRQHSRDSYARHAEKRREDVRLKRVAEPDQHRAALRASYQKHRERRTVDQREYREANPERFRAYRTNRKANLRNAAGHHSADDIARIFGSQNAECAGCSTSLVPAYHVDHIHPVSRGGSNWPDNLQLLCPFCNVSKGAKTMEEWRKVRNPKSNCAFICQ